MTLIDLVTARLKLTIIFYFTLNFTFITNSLSQSLNHPLSAHQSFQPQKFLTINDTINVFAVMVQFKPDEDAKTTGNGNFDLSTSYRSPIDYKGTKVLIDTIVDAPPHNKEYFSKHLVFLKNYFDKVSDGKVKINFIIPDKVYTLPNNMESYSPPKSNDYTKMANLVANTWKLVDSLSPEIDFSKFQSFFIFHAGAGRDIDLASIYGSDPTPYDLPSLFFNLKSLKNYFGDSFKGVPVNKGKNFIQNSAVIPEMEYRVLSGLGGSTLYQFSINGLIASSFGSYLGLPDLFNSKTGSTAIGRFGLMDGQSIFSYNGLFPPEPSAWEKVFLGWIEPTVISSGSKDLTIYAHRTDGSISNNELIYKIPINSREYFLVECRYRDPGKNGLKIKSWSNNTELEYHIMKDTSVFDQFGTVKLVDGVLTDVEDFDWSLPGGYDYKKNELNGGILIWHIDENVIDSKIADNNVNDDILHRGVSLLEADGSQDIGQNYSSYGITHPGYGSENGTPLDFWYNDLSYYSKDSVLRPAYKNIFSPTSNPNSLSFDGSNSHISISNFSKQGPIMTFSVKIGDEFIEILPNYPKKILQSINEKSDLISSDLTGDGYDEILVKNGTDLFCFDQKGSSVLSDPSGRMLDNVFSVTLSDFNKDNKSELFCDRIFNDNTKTHQIQSYEVKYNQGSNTLNQLFSYNSTFFQSDTLSLFSYFRDSDQYLIGLIKSKGITFDGKISSSTFIPKVDSIFTPLEKVNSFIIFDQNNSRSSNWFALGANRVKRKDGLTYSFSDFTQFKNLIGGDFNGTGTPDAAVIAYKKNLQEVHLILPSRLSLASDNNTINLPGPSKLFSNACTNCWDNISSSSAGDIDGDGKQDIVFTVFDNLYAYNFNGVLLPSFPIKFKNSTSLTSPVIGDIDSDKKNEVIVVSKDGKVYAFRNDGNLVSGFPVSIGVSPASSPIIFKALTNVGLAILGSDGYLYAWKLKGSYDANYLPWICEYANAGRTSVANELLFKQPEVNENLPKSKAYNWPNPVYGTTTKIRFFLKEESKVSIKIFDLSGEKVDELFTNGTGGIDNEVEWNVKDIQSGVYLARIEANISGSNSIAIIKIAVVK